MPNTVTLKFAKGSPANLAPLIFTGHDNFVVGRTEECRCRLPDDPAVADYHCVIEVNPPDIRIRDLSSDSGTWVNGLRIQTWEGNKASGYGDDHPYPGLDLKDGDIIRLGRTELIVGVKSETTTNPVLCRACGMDAFNELGGRVAGYYFCRACRDAISLNPPVRVLAAAARASGMIPYNNSWDDMPDEIAGCRIRRPLGKNPFGMVYLAERISDGREVVIKIVLPQVAVLSLIHI